MDRTVDFISATDESRNVSKSRRAISLPRFRHVVRSGRRSCCEIRTSTSPFSRMRFAVPAFPLPLHEAHAGQSRGTRFIVPAGLRRGEAFRIPVQRVLSLGQVPNAEEQLQTLSAPPWIPAQGELFPELTPVSS